MSSIITLWVKLTKEVGPKLMLARTTQAHIVNNHYVGKANQGDRPQHNASTPTSRIRDFMSKNPQTFHGTKVDEEPQRFIDEVFKVVDHMGFTPREKT